jgi:hypothetical protein
MSKWCFLFLLAICLTAFVSSQEKQDQELFGSWIAKEFEPDIPYLADSDGFLLVSLNDYVSFEIHTGPSKDRLMRRSCIGATPYGERLLPVPKGYWMFKCSQFRGPINKYITAQWLPVLEINKKLDQEIAKIQQYLLRLTNELPGQIAAKDAVKAMREQLKAELREQIKKEVIAELREQIKKEVLEELKKQAK